MTRELLIEMLQNCKDADTITCAKFCSRFNVNSSVIYSLFSGMRNFRKEAGVQYHWKNKHLDDNALISELKRVFNELKVPLTQELFDANSDYCSSDIHNHFRTWANACEIAGVPYGGNTSYVQMNNTSLIKQVFKSMGIDNVETEKSFDGLINPETGRKLRYDYYISELNMLVEVDGFSHFDKKRYERLFKSEFEKRVQLDNLKNEYAKLHGINLVRINQCDCTAIGLQKIFDCNCHITFNCNASTKQNELSKILDKETMIELYVNNRMSDQQIADKYDVDYNMVYRLRTEVYHIASRSCKEQKSKMNIAKLIECYLNDVLYRFMPEICGAQNCYRTLQKLLKENPSIADIKSLKKSGKAGSGQSDLKVEIYDRPPYVSFVGEIPNRGNA